MAKNGFLGMAGGQRPGAPVRPMPNPRLNPVAQQQPAQAAGGGFLGPRGGQQRHDLVMQFLEMAMNAAPNSGNPLLSALAPIAGAVIGARAEKVREDFRAAEVSAMTEAMLGPNGLSPAAQRALSVIESENAPDYLKKIAQQQFDAAMAPYLGGSAPARSGGRGRRSSGGRSSGGAGTGARLYGEYVIDGMLYGRTKDGRMIAYTGPDGKPVSAGGSPGVSSPAPAPVLPTLPSDPVIPRDPTGGLASAGGAGSGGLTDDELLKKYGG